jgi:hypothetical protein
MRVRPIHFVADVGEAVRFYEALGLQVQVRARTTVIQIDEQDPERYA